MFTKTSILSNLGTLDRAFRSAGSPREALFFSKLAVLELCGWIEESMDDIVLRCSIRKIKQAPNQKYIEDRVVKKTYGFDYEDNFRFMLIRLIGLINVERIESAINPTTQALLSSTLSTLKQIRNSQAHTHIRGVTGQINAPSVTLSQFHPVYDGLVAIDRELRKRKL